MGMLKFQRRLHGRDQRACLQVFSDQKRRHQRQAQAAGYCLYQDGVLFKNGPGG
jgi:hypothetical protein